MKTINDLKHLHNSEYFRGFEGLDGLTPIWLCEEQINKIPCDYTNPNCKWMFPAVGHGTHAIIVYWKYMNSLSKILINKEDRSRHILENMLYLNEINPTFCRWLRQDGFINVIEGDYFNFKTEMKFDVLLGNPPFTVGKNNPIWHKFVDKSFDLVNENGYVSLIHPNGWRNVSGKFKKTQELIKTKTCLHLEMFDVKDGFKTFGVNTPFDWYVVKNEKNEQKKLTKIKFQDGTIKNIDISKMSFIPNFGVDNINNLLAKNGEKSVEILHSESLYEVRKSHMSDVQNEEFNLPCVYSVLKDGSFTLKYSNEDKGHFGLPKLIMGNGANPTCFIDYNGEYGMTQFSFAIVDTIENLEIIKCIIENNEFANITKSVKYVATSGNPLIYPKIAMLFRKDFWKEFIDE